MRVKTAIERYVRSRTEHFAAPAHTGDLAQAARARPAGHRTSTSTRIVDRAGLARTRRPSRQRKHTMNWDRIKGNWKQVTGQVKSQWGKLTDDDLDVVAGQRDQLAGKIQERYGIAKDEAEKQLAAWQGKASDSWFKKD
jgi:uncharacterized protein YjbJ (UPF0337 family)